MSSAESILQSDDVPEIRDGRKVSYEHKLQLWSILIEDPTCPTTRILQKARERNLLTNLKTSVRHINRIRKGWNLSCEVGRPWPKDEKQDASQSSDQSSKPIEMIASMSFIGVHVFNIWLENQIFF